jgi:hypothetical protein
MSLNVQGSNLYFIDPVGDSNGPTIVEVGCVTTLDGIDASRDQVDTTCISSETRVLEAGLLSPGAASFSILFDPDDESHVRLHELYREGTSLQWALGFADGTAPPTSVDSNGDFVLPTTRTFLTFQGYVSSYPWSLAVGQKVTNALSLQIADFPTLHAAV